MMAALLGVSFLLVFLEKALVNRQRRGNEEVKVLQGPRPKSGDLDLHAPVKHPLRQSPEEVAADEVQEVEEVV